MGSDEGGNVVKETEKRLDVVPSQRPALVSAPIPVITHPPGLADVPQPHPAPSPLVDPQPVPGASRPVRPRRALWVGVAAVAVITVAAGGGVYAADQRAQAAEAA